MIVPQSAIAFIFPKTPLIVPKPRIVESDVSSAAVPISVPESAQGISDPIEARVTTKNTPPRRNYAWAYLMMRVFLVDVLKCERCGGRLKILAAIHPPDATRKILECLGLPSRAPPLAPAISDFTAHMDSF
jgi:hypothetical protein